MRTVEVENSDRRPTLTFRARRAEELRRVAARIRLHAVRMVARHGQGYLGQALSSAEIISTLFCATMDPGEPERPEATRDRFVLSPGHYVIAVYGALVECGLLTDQELAAYGVDGSSIEAIGTERTPGVDATCGSLGQGLSIAVGLALSGRIRGFPYRTYAFLSDGEMEEGQVWEAALFAAHQRLNRLAVVVDCNNSQVDGTVDKVTTLEPVEDKWRAFGWATQSVDGHDVEQLLQAFEMAKAEQYRPSVILARTNIIQGISFLTNDRDGHFIKLTPDEADRAARELEALSYA